MMNPGITERTFEFCYTAEFCHLHQGLLASHPHLPSQRQERDLGDDVDLRIHQGGFTHSIFFQHKVEVFGQHRIWNNTQFYDAHGGAYYRFGVDRNQHSTLLTLAQQAGNAFYCAPLFHTRSGTRPRGCRYCIGILPLGTLFHRKSLRFCRAANVVTASVAREPPLQPPTPSPYF